MVLTSKPWWEAIWARLLLEEVEQGLVAEALVDRRDDGDSLFADEGRPARHHFVQHTAQGVEVAARLRCLAEGLLRRHVEGRADERALGGEARAVEGDGEAEVAELRDGRRGTGD